MNKRRDISQLFTRFKELGIAEQIDYKKFYLYSIITHSTAIEGSTITEVENQLMFDEGYSPTGKAVIEQMMNLDLRDAYFKWLKWAQDTICITPETLCQMSASVMRRTGALYHTALGDFDSSLGELRRVNVQAGMGGRSYMSFQKVPDKLNEFCSWLNKRIVLVGRDDIENIYRLSFEAHYRLVTIHPWVDGNGRTSRLLTNLIQHHFGVLMSKVSKQNKAEYIQALIDARDKEDIEIFIEVMMSMHSRDIADLISNYEADTEASDIQINVQKDVQKQLSDRQRLLLTMIDAEPNITMEEMSKKTGVSVKTIQRDLITLHIVRKGGRKGGYWEITEPQTKTH